MSARRASVSVHSTIIIAATHAAFGLIVAPVLGPRDRGAVAWRGTASDRAMRSCSARAAQAALTHAAASTPIAAAEHIDPHAAIDITSDEAVLGVGGDAILKGNVRVRQGERELRADHAHYDPNSTAFEVQGGVEYTDALVHVTGVGGEYAQNDGADFTAAEFELRQRPARGAADVMHLTPDGKIRLSTCASPPARKEDEVWQLRAQCHHARHPRARRHGARRQGRLQGRADPVSAVGVLSAQQRPQERLSVSDPRQYDDERPAALRCPTTGTSRPTWMPPSSPRNIRSAASTSAGSCAI